MKDSLIGEFKLRSIHCWKAILKPNFAKAVLMLEVLTNASMIVVAYL